MSGFKFTEHDIAVLRVLLKQGDKWLTGFAIEKAVRHTGRVTDVGLVEASLRNLRPASYIENQRVIGEPFLHYRVRPSQREIVRIELGNLS